MSDNPVSHIRIGKHKLIEYEVAKEQCSALGRAGRELRRLLAAFYADEQQQFTQLSQPQHIQQLTDATLALMMTREYLGFQHANLDWIVQEFSLPAEVVERIDLPKPKGYLGRSGR
ncbi:hypothetical protein [Shewanella sp.]|uniref:hypothetical protein n=1 Tax=Shewanella sp. TaxID=50422 RepID=UPI003A9850D7